MLYDNGEKLLGKVCDIKEYISNNYNDYEEYTDLLEELQHYSNDTIVVINYDSSLCYLIDSFSEKNRIKQ